MFASPKKKIELTKFKNKIMKQLTLIAAVEELSLLPVDASLQIYWEPKTGFVYILDTKEKAGVPASATLITSGKPDRFFDLLHQLFTHHSFHKDDQE